MAEHRNPAVHIGQLNLRMRGASAETGRRLANGIVESLARKVPGDMRRQVGALRLRVRLPAGASETEMSEAVSEAIVKALRLGSRAAGAKQG
jgi:hypothetical protein